MPGEGDARAYARRALAISAGVTVLLWVVPGGDWLGRPLLLLSTLVHELGHGMAALLVGGHFVRLEVMGDGSGVAFTATTGSVRRAIVSAGGLVGPAVAALIGFVLGRRPSTSRLAVGALGLYLVVAMVLWIEGWVGLVVAGTMVALCGAALLLARTWAPQLLLVFLSVQLSLSVFSRRAYLFMELPPPAMSDSQAIAAALVGPYWFWGAVCGLFSVAVLLVGARLFVVGMLPPDDAAAGLGAGPGQAGWQPGHQ